LDTINRIANNTQFGNTKLLDGSLGVDTTRSDVANAAIESQQTTGLADVDLDDDTYHLKITTAKVEGVDEVASTVSDGLTVDLGATGDFFDDTSGAGGTAVNHDAVTAASFFSGDGAFAVGATIYHFDDTKTVQDALDAINGDVNSNYTISLDDSTHQFTLTAKDGLGASGDGGKLTIILGASEASTGATTGGVDEVVEVHDAAGELVDSSGNSLATPILLTAKALSDGTVLVNDDLGIEFDVALTDAESIGDKGEVYDVTKTGSSALFQIGANAGQTASISIGAVNPSELATGVANGSGFASLDDVDVTSASKAQDTIGLVDAAISEISSLRGTLGAFQQNTLESNANNLRVTLENTVNAESVIRDTDFAMETASFTKNQVLMQAGTTVLANANQIPQLVLALLGR
jgi:flagellin